MTAEEIIKEMVSKNNCDPTAKKIVLVEESKDYFKIEISSSEENCIIIKEIGDRNLKERCYSRLLTTIINNALEYKPAFLQSQK